MKTILIISKKTEQVLCSLIQFCKLINKFQITQLLPIKRFFYTKIQKKLIGSYKSMFFHKRPTFKYNNEPGVCNYRMIGLVTILIFRICNQLHKLIRLGQPNMINIKHHQYYVLQLVIHGNNKITNNFYLSVYS